MDAADNERNAVFNELLSNLLAGPSYPLSTLCQSDGRKRPRPFQQLLQFCNNNTCQLSKLFSMIFESTLKTYSGYELLKFVIMMQALVSLLNDNSELATCIKSNSAALKGLPSRLPDEETESLKTEVEKLLEMTGESSRIGTCAVEEVSTSRVETTIVKNETIYTSPISLSQAATGCSNVATPLGSMNNSSFLGAPSANRPQWIVSRVDRKRLIEMMEVDRSEQKKWREAAWSRLKDKDVMAECRMLLKKAKGLSELTMANVKLQQERFESVNSERFGSLKKKRTVEGSVEKERKRVQVDAKKLVIVFDLNDSITNLDRCLNHKDPVIKRAAEGVTDLLSRLKRLFYYRDLKGFEMPHIRYYKADDDGGDLSKYNFNSDDLARYVDGKPFKDSTKKFYRERAYRYRQIGKDYEDAFLLKNLLDNKEYYKTVGHLNTLDRVNENLHIRRAFQQLHDRGAQLFIVTDDHLILSLAKSYAFGYNQLVPAENILTIGKLGLDWSIERIRERMMKDAEILIIGGEKNKRYFEEPCRKFKCKYVQCDNGSQVLRSLQDLL